jgi:hypothetical protein
MHTLTLHKATRKIGAHQTSREYFDFYVSGKSLKDGSVVFFFTGKKHSGNEQCKEFFFTTKFFGVTLGGNRNMSYKKFTVSNYYL